MWSELAFNFQNGNVYIILIMVMGFIGVSMTFERFFTLTRVYYIDFDKFLTNIRKMIKAKDIDRAISLCKSASTTSLPRIALKALEASETDPSTVKGTIEEEAIEFLPKLEARIGFISSLATLIMLVGILGTISALWDSFHSINVLDTAKKQASLAQGIATSLNSTALGIIMCMLLLFFDQIVRNISIQISEKIHFGVTVLHNLLVPKDVAYAPMPMPMPDAGVTQKAEADEDIEDEEDDDDDFDDASVEDIKDEEEII